MTETSQENDPALSSPREMRADICVIGAGAAGLSTAAGAAMLGLNVVLFEKGEMGGDCLNYGCVPSKALLSAAKHAQTVREATKFGIRTTPPVTDWDKVKAHVRTAIDTIAPVDSQERFEGLGVTVIREAARFQDANTIVSDTTRVSARRIVIATGSRALIPPIPGLESVPFLTNETLFDLPDLPEHLIILGGGPIGTEMAQGFNRLGAKVTLIEMDKLLGRSHTDHALRVAEALREEGVNLLEHHRATRIGKDGNQITVTVERDGQAVALTGSHLLVAVGRRPVLEPLTLAAGNVAHDAKGIHVGENLRSSSNRKVWALGDAAGMEQFTHVAGWHASVFIRRALFKARTKAHSLPIPRVTYTSPELAEIGLTEAEARAMHGDGLSVSHFAYHENDRAIAEAKTTGEARLFVHKGRVVGASILGDGAGETLQMLALAMSNGLKLKDLTNFISPYPTRTEVIKRAASSHFSDILFSPRVKKLVGLLQRIP